MQPETTTNPQSTARRDRMAHAYCALCVPRPERGQPITALCGTVHTFDGHRSGTEYCVVCESLLDARTLECGHPGPNNGR